MSDILKSMRSYLEMEKESGISEYLFTSKPKDVRLSLVKNGVSHCQKCPLGKMRKNIVFGSGNINAKLMFVGEAPGHEEDIQGMPFVGEAGALLTKIIEAMGIKRDDVYICNILKCRPPQNRNPLPAEISTCIDYLYAQIDTIKPRVICGLGKFASQTLLNTEMPISKLRGNWHEYRGMKFMPTYHPAYLLRNPKDKKLVWEDMKKILEILNG
ncbi:MAG: uracil-DNA glycosylase [Candidatus Omnitrophica bacterium]|nr:uracil-DNA glycosylase [Candidatus Omnitrophota bacterium]